MSPLPNHKGGLRRPAEMQLLGDSDEISEVAKLHALPSGVECPWSIAERAHAVCTASAPLGPPATPQTWSSR